MSWPSSRASRSSAEYVSNYALGDEQAGVASLLAANPQIDGILTAGYGTGAIQALKDAGRPLVPIVMFAYNGSATACAEEPGLKCFIYTHPPYLSAEAIKLAVDILDGGRRRTPRSCGDYPRLTTDVIESDIQRGLHVREARDRQERLPRPAARPRPAVEPGLARHHAPGSCRRLS